MEFSGEEDEIELSLGLSIGGGCRKRMKKNEAPASGGGKAEEDDEVVKKKKMQAIRRQEARRKREEKKKQMKRNNIVKVEREMQGGVVKSESELNTTSYAFPVYAYPTPFQYVPFANGFAFPCVVPGVYGAEMENVSGDKCVATPTVSFRPWNGVNEEGNVKAVSNGSLGYSSAVSENRSISSQDDSSCDSASHSKSAKTELCSSTSGSDVPGYSNPTAITNPSTNANGQNAPPATSLPTVPKVSKEDSPAVELKPANVLISRSTSLPQPQTPVTKDNKVDTNSPSKPPTPQASDNQKPTSPLSQMPCVSATGNGPEGKTITGFLYRYNTTAEVTIVCVCHGESFSPAEFVKHAGGQDITHPLRHITVVPTTF